MPDCSKITSFVNKVKSRGLTFLWFFPYIFRRICCRSSCDAVMRGDPLWRLWISTVDSCVSILGLPGAETHTLTHHGRSRAGMGCKQEPLIFIKPHFYLLRANTTNPSFVWFIFKFQCMHMHTHSNPHLAFKPTLQSAVSSHTLPGLISSHPLHCIQSAAPRGSANMQWSPAAKAFGWEEIHGSRGSAPGGPFML